MCKNIQSQFESSFHCYMSHSHTHHKSWGSGVFGKGVGWFGHQIWRPKLFSLSSSWEVPILGQGEVIWGDQMWRQKILLVRRLVSIWGKIGKFYHFFLQAASDLRRGGLNEENESWARGRESGNLYQSAGQSLTIHDFQSLIIGRSIFDNWQVNLWQFAKKI